MCQIRYCSKARPNEWIDRVTIIREGETLERSLSNSWLSDRTIRESQRSQSNFTGTASSSPIKRAVNHAIPRSD